MKKTMHNYFNIKSLILGLILVSPLFGTAQQDMQFGHYPFSQIFYNPAYAGTREALTGSFLYHGHLMKFPGAPNAQSFNIHSPIKMTNSGIGLTAHTDQMAVTRTITINGVYSYRIPLRSGFLSLGLNAGVNNLNERFGELTTATPGDEQYMESYSLWGFNAGIGAYYYNKKFFVGVGAPRLLNNDWDIVEGKGKTLFDLAKVPAYLTAGFIFNLSSGLKLMPTTLIKTVSGMPLAADVTLLLLIKEKFWVGPYYRTSRFFGLMVGAEIANLIRIGYAGEITSNSILKHNFGTHEIMLGFNLGAKKPLSYQSLRYF